MGVCREAPRAPAFTHGHVCTIVFPRGGVSKTNVNPFPSTEYVPIFPVKLFSACARRPQVGIATFPSAGRGLPRPSVRRQAGV